MLVCLSESTVPARIIAVYVLQTLIFGTDELQHGPFIFHDVPCKGKCAQRRESRPGFTEISVQTHSHHDCTSVANVLKTFHNANFARMVVLELPELMKCFTVSVAGLS